MHPKKSTAALLGAGLLLGLPAWGLGEWPQWRGAARDGSAAEGGPPREWPEQPVLLWQRDVGGGYSGPVVDGGSVWVHARIEDQEVVRRLTLAGGEELWSRRYGSDFRQDPSARSAGRGPYATPSLADGRLFTVGVETVLSAWDAETGTLLWRKRYAEEFDPTFPEYGAAASPLVWDGLCFVHFGGKPLWAAEQSGRGAMIALGAEDGREVWRWDRDRPAIGASPIIHDVERQGQLIFKSESLILGLDPRTGEELWRIPYKVAMDNTIVTPLFVSGRLMTSDWEMGISAWRIRSQGGVWSVHELWRNREVYMAMSSPVVAGGQLVGFSYMRKGQLFGLDPKDGRVLWRGDPRSGEHASLVASGNHVLVFLEDGSLVVGEVTAERFRTLRRYRLGSSGTWAHPAVVGDRILVKDGRQLLVYRLAAGPKERIEMSARADGCAEKLIPPR